MNATPAVPESVVASQSHQPFDKMVSNVLATTIALHDWRFYVNNEPIAGEVLTGNKMMLPVILWQAEQMHRLLMNRSLGVAFRSDPDAAVGATAVINAVPGQARCAYLLFSLEVLSQALENFTINGPDLPVEAIDVRESILKGRRIPPRGTAASLDHLVQGFFQDSQLGNLPWTPDSNPKAPSLGSPSGS